MSLLFLYRSVKACLEKMIGGATDENIDTSQDKPTLREICHRRGLACFTEQRPLLRLRLDSDQVVYVDSNVAA